MTTPAELFARFRADPPAPIVITEATCRGCRDLARQVAELTERTYVLAAQEARARTDAHWTTKDLIHAQDRAFKAEMRLGERTAQGKLSLDPAEREAVRREFSADVPVAPAEAPVVWGSE